MQIRTSQTLPKKYNIFSRIDQLATYGTKSNKKNEAQKSVYLPWLICKLIITIEAWFFPIYRTIP